MQALSSSSYSRALRAALAGCITAMVLGEASMTAAQDVAVDGGAGDAALDGGPKGAWLDAASKDAPLDAPSSNAGASGPDAAREPAADVDLLEVARERFAQGVELAQRRQFVQAAQRFEEALAVRDTPAIRFNLASALYEAGQHVDSYNHLTHVLEAPDLAPEVRQRAQVLEDALRDYVGTLTVTAAGEERLRLMVDGEPLPDDRLGKPFAVPPGPHVVEAYRERQRVSRRELDVLARTRAVVDMRVVAGPEQAAQTLSSDQTVPASDGSTRERVDGPRPFGVRDWRLWVTVGGAVAVAAAVGLAVGLRDGESAESLSGDFEPGVLTW